MTQLNVTPVENDNRLAMLTLSENDLISALCLPGETKLVGLTIDASDRTVYIVVSSPDLPLVPRGTRPPIANPVIETTFEWGLP